MPSAPNTRREVGHQDSNDNSDRSRQTVSTRRWTDGVWRHGPSSPPGTPYAGTGGAARRPEMPSAPNTRREVGHQDSNNNSDRSRQTVSTRRWTDGVCGHGPSSPPGTPIKSLIRAGIGRPEEPPARGGALPKFGAWDAKDPNTGDGFTMIFQKASVEKKEGGPLHIPQMGNELLPGSLEDPHQNQSSAQSKRPSQSRRGNVSSHHY
ncbi:unnamed protein product [Sphagnum balticum]